MRKIVAVSALLLASWSVQADDIKNAIDEGMKLYRAGDMSGAAAQLDYASTLIRQAKGQAMASAFPAPLAGWQAEDASSQGSGGMMFGGGASASRSYYKDESSLTISITSDSPMLQSVMILFSNPSIMAMSGGRLVQIQGEKAILQREGNLQLTMVLDGKVLITLEGGGITEADIMAYANAISFAKIRAK
jgi:hypothetical protein